MVNMINAAYVAYMACGAWLFNDMWNWLGSL